MGIDEKKKEKQGTRDSNSQHAVLETAALPIELVPFFSYFASAAREDAHTEADTLPRPRAYSNYRGKPKYLLIVNERIRP